MKKRTWTNRIPVSALIALVGLGIGISCSKDSTVSSIDPTLRATKPTTSSSHLSTNFTDPFPGMTLDGRRVAIGGPDAAEKYLRIITKCLAVVMADAELRLDLYRVVPPIEQGEIHISKIADRFPRVLEKLSEGFKDAVARGAISGALAQLINDAPSDAEAIYKASRSLFELELSVANPPEHAWDPIQPIPVVFAPIDDEGATSIEGIDTSLQPIFMPLSGPSTTCLVLNFDEDLALSYERNAGGVSFVPQDKRLWTWQNVLNFFSVSPAYAHYPPFPLDDNPGTPHDPCYSEDILQPVAGIEIYDDHEVWPMGDPEIFMGINWKTNPEPVQPYRTAEEDLEELDDTNVWYTDFADLRTLHGTCGPSGKLETVYVLEWDPWPGEGDDLGRWHNRTIPAGGFAPNQVDLSTSDVWLRMRRTDEDAWTLPHRGRGWHSHEKKK